MIFKDIDRPIGDLASDVFEDKEFPKNASFKEARAHLRNKQACNDCIEAMDEAGKVWKATQALIKW